MFRLLIQPWMWLINIAENYHKQSWENLWDLRRGIRVKKQQKMGWSEWDRNNKMQWRQGANLYPTPRCNRRKNAAPLARMASRQFLAEISFYMTNVLEVYTDTTRVDTGGSGNYQRRGGSNLHLQTFTDN